MEFVSQIFPRDGRQIGPICPRGKIWETFFANTLSFTGTKIFPQKMFPRGFVRVCVWVGGGVWVLSNQIKIKSNQNQNQSIKIKTSEVTVTSFCSHESTPALTRAPESTLIHQKDRKICEVRVPPSALMPESTLIHQIGFTRTNCAWIALNLFAAEVPQRAPCSSSHYPLSLNSWPPTTPPYITYRACSL